MIRHTMLLAMAWATGWLVIDQTLNVMGYPHTIHIGGVLRGETALFDWPESWSGIKEYSD